MDPKSVLLGLREKSVGLSKAQTRIPWREIITLDKSDIIVYRKMDYEWQILVSDREEMQRKYPKAMVVPATIDEIMLLYVKGER